MFICSISELYGIECIRSFRQLERFNYSLGFEVLEEFDERIASIAFFIASSVFDSAFLEDIGESKSRRHFVEFDFRNANHRIILEHDVHFGILHVGHVEQCGIVGQQLFSVAGDNHERRFAVERNGCIGILPVDRRRCVLARE